MHHALHMVHSWCIHSCVWLSAGGLDTGSFVDDPHAFPLLPPSHPPPRGGTLMRHNRACSGGVLHGARVSHHDAPNGHFGPNKACGTARRFATIGVWGLQEIVQRDTRRHGQPPAASCWQQRESCTLRHIRVLLLFWYWEIYSTCDMPPATQIEPTMRRRCMRDNMAEQTPLQNQCWKRTLTCIVHEASYLASITGMGGDGAADGMPALAVERTALPHVRPGARCVRTARHACHGCTLGGAQAGLPRCRACNWMFRITRMPGAMCRSARAPAGHAAPPPPREQPEPTFSPS